MKSPKLFLVWDSFLLAHYITINYFNIVGERMTYQYKQSQEEFLMFYDFDERLRDDDDGILDGTDCLFNDADAWDDALDNMEADGCSIDPFFEVV